MVKFIFGRSGTGKTDTVCRMAADSLASGRQVYLIVPEQMAVDAESRMADLTGDAPSLNLEILNFRRLCNRVFREYGGLSYSYMTKSGKTLMMWQTLTELAPMLKCKTKVDRNTVSRMLGAVSEFKSYCITPRDLERAAESLGDCGKDKALSDKLYDLSLVFAAYTNLLAQTSEDASDDLTNAAALLREHSFFGGADVYFDSFYGFTPQEFAVIEAVIRSADNCVFSLCLDAGDELFVNQGKTAERLAKIAASLGKETEALTLTENLRAAMPELKHIEAHLWSLASADDLSYKDDVTALSLFECQNKFSECEAVATDICKRVRSGASWHDFAITTRGIDSYDGILDVILEKYGIPHFSSHRVDIKTKPVIKLILSALSLKTSNFRTDDIISYIKTGLCSLTPDEISAFENYIETWKLRGISRYKDDFTMNPDGYTARFTEKAARVLEQVNSIREKVITPLIDFHAELDNASSVKDFAGALYGFLCKLEIPEKLEILAANQRVSNPVLAQEYEQIWSVLIDALDELCTVTPELCVDTQTFAEILNVVFDETDIGRIPATVDEVISGDASLLRASVKHVYILGANEGSFPLAPKETGIFTDSDRALLSSIGLELSEGGDYRCADERFIFYRAVTCAALSVTVVWSSSDLSGQSMMPSLAVARLRALFPQIKVKDFANLPIEERLEGRANIIEYIAECDGTPLGLALREYAEKDESLKRRVARLSVPLSIGEDSLSKETADALFQGNLALSQSKLETYVLCHLSYFCKYVLKLGEQKNEKFSAADVGTFIHHVLEVFVKNAEENQLFSNISDEQIDTMVDSIVSGYIKDVCRVAPEFSGSRLAHLFARLKRTSRILCKNLAAEFSQSKFRPAFYELPIAFPKPDAATVEPLSVKLSDGSLAYVYGTVDRVDIMEHDGKCYVRVVDYKTSSKAFSANNISLGLDMQMLIYLFSIYKNGQSPRSALSIAENAEIVPAGILYFTADVPPVNLNAKQSPEEIEKSACSDISRSGLLINDIEVLRAMEPGLSGMYIPVKAKKDGGLHANSHVASLKEFQELLSTIETNIQQIGNEIKRGNASADPMTTKAKDPCMYCQMRPICRKSISGGDE